MAEDKDEPFRGEAGPGEPPDPDQAEHLTAPEAEEPHPLSDAGPDEASIEAAAPPLTPPPFAPPPETKTVRVKQPSRAPLLLGALILGALGGVGGVMALRYFDTLDGSPSTDRLADLNARSIELEKKADASTAALSSMQSRLASAESAAGKASAAAAAAVGEMRKSLDASGTAPATAGQSDMAPVASKVEAVESRVGGFESRMAALQTKVGAVEAALAAPKIDARAKQDQDVAQALSTTHATALVAGALVQHVVAGSPYQGDIAALENLKVSEAALAPLRAHAKTGVSKVSDLAESFAAMAPTLELSEPPPEGGLLDRLTHDALNLVRIRKQAEPSDAGAPGLVAAIQSALTRLDLVKAYALWSQLPPELKAKSASWGDGAKARLDAVAAANAIEGDAVAALGKPKS